MGEVGPDCEQQTDKNTQHGSGSVASFNACMVQHAQQQGKDLIRYGGIALTHATDGGP